MPTYEVTSPEGTKYRVNAPDGATQEDAIAYVRKNFKPQTLQSSVTMDAPGATADAQPSKPAGSQLLRQLGLTARYGLEGVGDTLDTLASPIRAGLNAILPAKKQTLSGLVTGAEQQPAIIGRSGKTVADFIGLPEPQTATERIVGDASRMMAGAAAPVGLAGQVASRTAGTTQAVANLAASNPGMQLLSGGSAGASGGYVRENGGNDVDQFAASLLGGVAAPLAASGAMSAGGRIASAAQKAVSSSTPEMIVNVKIDNALKDSGLTLGQLAPNVRASLQRDVQAALDTGGQVSPDAIRRLADYRLTNTTPTQAGITLDPVIVTQQKNLSKLGSNSKDATAQQLGRVEFANNNQIIANLNELGAGNAGDRLSGGQRVMDALSARNDKAKSIIGQYYDAARASDGRGAGLNPQHFATKANDLLDQSLLGGKLPSDVRNLLNKSATGDMPLTVDTAEQFKTQIGDLQRASSDAAERKALGMVRQALDDTPLLDPAQMGQPAIDAFNKARRLNRAWMNIVDKTPALQAVRDGIEPDKFVQQFIIGNGGNANVMDVAMLKNSIKSNPDAIMAVKSQMVDYLKKSALSGAADEVGNVSQSAFNKALNSIGDRKLALFFSPDEINLLKANGRVASYEQFQPRGSAVNNSNTAGAGLAAILDRVANSPLLSKLPMGKMLADPAQNISVGIKSKRALSAPNALLAPIAQLPKAPAGLLVSPAVFAQPQEDKRGLLSLP